ncbi:MAG: hypothetical protein AABP62_28250 [Planctomycetota bacterium]
MMEWGQKKRSANPLRDSGCGEDAVFRGVAISEEDKVIYGFVDESEKVGPFDADDDIASGRTKEFNNVDDMLASLKKPW